LHRKICPCLPWHLELVSALPNTSNMHHVKKKFSIFYFSFTFLNTSASKQLPRVITFTTVGELDSFYDSTASCIGYSDGSLLPDLKWRAARGFSVSAVVFGSLGLLSVIYALNRLHSGVLNRPHLGCLCFFFTGLFSLTLFFQALTFIFLRSNGCKKFPEIDFLGHAIISASQKGTCQRAPTANLGIAACVLWFVCALTSAYICLKAQPVP
jgi:hypothetical protein